MSRFRIATLVLAGIAFVAFAVGPRPRLMPDLSPVALPEDLSGAALDAWLAAAEARVPGVLPDTEKSIVWADPAAKTRTKLAVVYLHGFSATRQEVAPLAEQLAARLGANLFCTRFRGHGQDGAALGAATANDWLNDTAEAVAIGERLGDRVILVGTSTGATLALWWAATQPSARLHVLVLISPNLGLRDTRARFALWPWGRTFADLITGGSHRWTPRNQQQGRYWTTSYPTSAIVEMLTLVDALARTDFRRIATPTLIFHSDDDHIVSLEVLRARLPEIGGQPMRVVEIPSPGDPDKHVLAGRILSPGGTQPILDRTVEFLRSLP